MTSTNDERHNDKPADNRAEKNAKTRRAEAMKAEQARLQKEDADFKKRKAEEVKAATAKAEADAKLAKSLKAPTTFQQGVTYKLTGQLTEELGAMIRHCANSGGKLLPADVQLQWLSVDKRVARDVMQRAYPLALQMGIMGVVNEQHHTLSFPGSGGRIEFAWPGKAVAP